jgi:hypothetical protein
MRRSVRRAACTYCAAYGDILSPSCKASLTQAIFTRTAQLQLPCTHTHIDTIPLWGQSSLHKLQSPLPCISQVLPPSQATRFTESPSVPIHLPPKALDIWPLGVCCLHEKGGNEHEFMQRVTCTRTEAPIRRIGRSTSVHDGSAIVRVEIVLPNFSSIPCCNGRSTRF